MIASIEEPKLEDTTLEPKEKDTPQSATRTVPTLIGYTNLQTLKIEGFLRQQSVIILIDTGSTHNFMSSKISGDFHDFTQDRTMMLKDFLDDDLRSTAQDHKKIEPLKWRNQKRGRIIVELHEA
ncbi:hypothetical protein B296_00037865 [Ensete ventricosum]|uniref:Uncharacterized protein n=1 Tax=Ensete ventricosum TaxID=4639 RepID=A0A426XLP7_ENSVE|nr:hypothetical protein B296_00037865 [Ensete ventricosum]